MKDITIDKKFKEVKLTNTVHYINEDNFLNDLKTEKFKIYDVECAKYKNEKIVIFYCVENNNLTSYVVKNVNNVYDLLGIAYQYTTDNWYKYKYAHGLGYKFYVQQEKFFSEEINKKEIKIYSDIEKPSDDILYHFSFKVDKNTDMLCSDENNKAFCEITFHKNVDDLKTMIKKCIDRSESKYLTGDMLNELVETVPCKERPYKVYIYGVDDSSYTKTFKTFEEVKDIALCLQMFDKVYTQEFIEEFNFIFTN